jgi:hypothetical protein
MLRIERLYVVSSQQVADYEKVAARFTARPASDPEPESPESPQLNSPVRGALRVSVSTYNGSPAGRLVRRRLPSESTSILASRPKQQSAASPTDVVSSTWPVSIDHRINDIAPPEA